MSDTSVSRWVRGYESKRGEFTVEHRLPDSISLEQLRELFNITDENPMYDCYPIGPAQAEVLGRAVGHELVVDGVEFFLEASSEE